MRTRLQSSAVLLGELSLWVENYELGGAAMCKSLHCPLNGQNCWYCLNNAEGETSADITALGTGVSHGRHVS